MLLSIFVGKTNKNQKFAGRASGSETAMRQLGNKFIREKIEFFVVCVQRQKINETDLMNKLNKPISAAPKLAYLFELKFIISQLDKNK